MAKDRTKSRRKINIPLKLQIALSFFVLLSVLILVCAVVINLFLRDYYIKNKQTAIKFAYLMVNTAFNEGDYSSDNVEIEMQRVCETYNISILVMDESTSTVLASVNDTDNLSRQLLDNLFTSQQEGFTIEKEENYTLKIQDDFRTGDSYLEMWGFLDNGNLFLIRSAVKGIEESVSIANRFLAYIAIMVVIISIFIAARSAAQISKPLKELADISEKMTKLDFGVKYKGHGASEIETLGHNINELSKSLEKTISELKTANIELTHDLEKRTEYDKARNEFISNVSHELKTPLSLVQGYAEGLKECVNDDEESREFYCDVIIDEANRMNTMVKKLLTLNQLELGGETVTIEHFDIVALIRNYIQTVDILIRQNDATVIFSEEKPIYVWGDEFKAEEVLMNYFSNAMNHLDGERKIIISISVNPDQKSVRVSVFNNGNPIPEEALSHLWEKFYKVDKARTREYGGSGIGLSIVKAIQDSLNQGYGAVNHEDGVEFYFELDASEY